MKQKCTLVLHKYSVPLLLDWKLSSGVSCFHWSSLRCFYTLIGVHLWQIQFIGNYLERHTPVYILSHSWQCLSERKPSLEVEGSVRRAPRQDCVEAQTWGRVPKHFWSIEWTQEPTRLFLELATCPNWAIGEKGLGQGGEQEPDGHSDRVPLWRWENLPEGQPSLQYLGLYGRVARPKPLLSKRQMTAKRHLKHSHHERQDSLV